MRPQLATPAPRRTEAPKAVVTVADVSGTLVDKTADLTGTVRSVLFHSEKDNFTVARLRVDDKEVLEAPVGVEVEG